MAKNMNQPQFEYFSHESNYVSPAEMTPDARERIKQRNTRLGRKTLEIFNQGF